MLISRKAFLGILVFAVANSVEATVLRFQSVVAGVSVGYDGMGVSDSGNNFVEAYDPNGSTFATINPNTGEIKFRALASQAGRMETSAKGSIQFSFRPETGPIFFPEGSIKADFHSTMTRNAVLGINTLGGAAQTVSQHQASIFGGSKGSGLSALIDVTDFVGLPFPRIFEPNPVTLNSGAEVDWSAGHLTSSISSNPFLLEEDQTLTFFIGFRAAARITEQGLADSDGSNTVNFSLTLPDNVTLVDVPQSYSWISVATVPLPSTYLFFIAGLGVLHLFRSQRQTKTL